MKVKDLLEKLKGYEDYDLEVLADVIFKDGDNEEIQAEVGKLTYFDNSLSEKKITLKFETPVELQYHDLA